jgi:hypothetical protein
MLCKSCPAAAAAAAHIPNWSTASAKPGIASPVLTLARACRWWSDDARFGLYKTEDEKTAGTIYITCYFAFVTTFIMLLLCRDGSFSIWHVTGSTFLHNTLFKRVLRVGCSGRPVRACKHQAYTQRSEKLVLSKYLETKSAI